MRKTLSALICAVTTLCAAGSLEAKTKTHKTTKIAAAKATSSSPYLQCVTFARQFTGMQIFGDAWTWWEKANAKYEEGQAPKPGAVLVFRSQGKMKLGHVAVVSQIITDRYIQITHANWSPIGGRRGKVEENVNVLDVSENGDWSKVKVWYGPLNDLGSTIYTTYGFIYNNGQEQASKDAGKETGKSTVKTAPARGMDRAAQIAMVNANEIPDDLRSALTPASTGAAAKPVMVSAHTGGTSAQALVAKLDANVDAAKAAGREIDAHAVKKIVRPN